MTKFLTKEKKEQLKYELQNLMYVIIAVILAFIAGGLFMLIQGYNPLEAYGMMFSSAFKNFDTVIRRATLYIFSGLAVAIPVRCGMFNMGGEGQIIVGGFVAAICGIYLKLPPVLLPIVCILAAMICGAFFAGISATMKLKFGSSEVVTGIMMNYVILYVMQYFTMYTFRGSANSAETALIQDAAKIPRFSEYSQSSYTIFIAMGAAFLLAFIMNRTRFGLELKSAGFNRTAASYQGVNVGAMSIASMLIGGALAGAGGAVEVCGGKYLFMDGYFANYGFDGVAVAYMAKNNPLGVIITAFFISVIKVGAVTLDRRLGLSIFYAIALQGIIIALLVSPYCVESIFEKIRLRKTLKKEKLAAAKEAN